MSSRPAPRDLRASDSDRDRVLAVLSDAVADGRLTQAEFTERASVACAAKALGELAELTADLSEVTARYVGPQYEDDLNTLRLGGYIVVDVAVSRAITKNVELYAAAENIFDRTYSTGRTTDGVISIGEPFMARGGLRLRF